MSFENDILRLLLLENYMPSAKSDSNSEPKVDSAIESLDSSVGFGDRVYAARKFGNKIWMINNLDLSLTRLGFTADMATRTEHGIKYYTWNDAMNISSQLPGWHLPSVEEWEELNKYRNHVGSGVFESLFNLFPTGYIDEDSERSGTDHFACFWTSAKNNCTANGAFFDLKDGQFAICRYATRSVGRCVRLAKDD